MKKAIKFFFLLMITAFSFLFVLTGCNNSEAISIKCDNCGALIEENSKFCPSCGTECNKEEKMCECQNCNEMIPESSKFCPNCGLQLKEEDTDNSDNSGNDNELENLDYDSIRIEMSNFCNGGRYTIYNGWIYSIDFDNNGSSIFSKMRTDKTDYSIITKGTPNYISVDGEYIYFILNYDNNRCLYRCRLGGNELTRLSESNVWYLQVNEDYLYYNKYDISTGKTCGFYRSNKDGSNEELVLDKEIYYSYIVGNELYYQDDADNEKIHKYNLINKNDETITSGISYSFVLDGDFAYYIKNDISTGLGKYSGYLVKINIKTKEETILYNGVHTSGILVNGSRIYFINTNDSDRIYSIDKSGDNIMLISQDTNCAYLYIFKDKLMYHDYDEEKYYIDAVYLCNTDGSNKIKIN